MAEGFVRSDGSDYITVTGMMGSPTSFTLSAWTNLTTTDVNAADIISLGRQQSYCDMTSSGKEMALTYTGQSWNTTTPQPIMRTGWHYVVYTLDDAGNSQQVYVDGQPRWFFNNIATTPNYTAEQIH